MRIIYIHQYFKLPNENGGTRSFDLASSFVKNGYEVVVITSTSDVKYKKNNLWSIEKQKGIEIHRIYIPYSNHLSYVKRTMMFLRFLVFSNFHILKISSDLVLATSTPLTIGIPALLKKLVSKTPYIFEVRDLWPEAVIAIGAVKNIFLKKTLYTLEKLIYKNASAIVPLSSDMQNSIISRFPNFADKTGVVIENISNIERFTNTETKLHIGGIIDFQPRFSILYAGTFGKVNGIEKVIELAEKTFLIDRTVIYILIGDGAEKEKVTQLAGKKGVLNKNVYILNSISKDELPLWYELASMGSSFVIDIKELWANSANKFFDTLAAGKPILINHEGWQAKAIRDYNVGYVLPNIISMEVAEKFIRYTQNTILIKEQGLNAINLAREKYSLERATSKYLEVIDKVISDKTISAF